MSSSGMDPNKSEKVAKSAKNPAPAAAEPQAEAPVAAEAEAAAPKVEASAAAPETATASETVVAPKADAPTGPAKPNSPPLFEPEKMGILNDVNIAVTIEIGRAELKIKDLLNLTKGAIIELNKTSGDPVEVYATGKLISLGDIITVNGRYCVRLSAFKDGVQLGAKNNGK